MLKPFLGVAAAGVLAVFVWKVLGFLLLPLLGTVLSLLFTLMKLAVVVALVWFFLRLFRKPTDGEAPAD
ncbi:MAG: hypothetical protein ACREMF_07900 [Gemmatimonadales bacterium]